MSCHVVFCIHLYSRVLFVRVFVLTTRPLRSTNMGIYFAPAFASIVVIVIVIIVVVVIDALGFSVR